MNYRICPDYGTLYTGWASNEFCPRCGARLKKITREKWEKLHTERKEAKEPLIMMAKV